MFDYSGTMILPWSIAGWKTLQIDKAHPPILAKTGPNKWIFGGDYTEVYKALFLGGWTKEDVQFVFSFPPCTDLASSGARWWKQKRQNDWGFQIKAMRAVLFAEELAKHADCGYMIENPVGAIPRNWRKWDHRFHPHQFTGFCADDNYYKSTCLWTKDFIMPSDNKNPALGKPDKRIHMMPGGKSQKRKRSYTPSGFSWAVYYANHENIAWRMKTVRAG